MKYYEMPLSVWDYPREIIKLAGIEFTKKELDWLWSNGVRYIVKDDLLYDIFLVVNKDHKEVYLARKIFRFKERKTARGRYWIMTAAEVNVSYAKDGVPTLIETL